MHDFPVARPQLDRLNPLRFGEVGRDVEVLVLDHPVGRDLVLLLHFEDDVRLSHGPAFGIDRRRRQVLRVALRRAGVGPRDQHLLLFVGQPALVQERAFRRRRVPGRHVSLADLVANVLGMRPDVVVGQERHRRNLARAMAGRAVAEEDRCDVFGIGGCWRCASWADARPCLRAKGHRGPRATNASSSSRRLSKKCDRLNSNAERPAQTEAALRCRGRCKCDQL